MPFWMIPTAIAAGSALYQGISSSNTNKANARRSAAAGAYNFEALTKAGDTNAALELATSGLNASLLEGETSIKLIANRAIRQYNAGLSLMIGEYNGRLNEREASLLWEEADLELFQMDQEKMRRQGAIVASFASSGIHESMPWAMT